MSEPQIQEPVFLIEVEKISPNPFQPRRDFNEEELQNLASSIREFGILQPLVVTKIEEINEAGATVRYQLIAGERRFLAAKKIGLERVPAVVKNVKLDRQRLEMAIVENVQRANLNAIEAARAYARLSDQFQLTQREIAAKIGKSREVIANTMRLLQLPSAMQEAVSRGQLSESQARLLLSVEEVAQQELLFNDILKNNLSVRELKARVDEHKRQKMAAEAPPGAASADPEADALQHQLEELLGTPVKLERSGTTGKITIAFYSPEELQALIQKLTPRQPLNEISQSEQSPEATAPGLPTDFTI